MGNSEAITARGCPSNPSSKNSGDIQGYGVYRFNQNLTGELPGAPALCRKQDLVPAQRHPHKFLVAESQMPQIWGASFSNSVKRLGGPHESGFNALLLDLHVEFYPLPIFLALISEPAAGPLTLRYIHAGYNWDGTTGN